MYIQNWLWRLNHSLNITEWIEETITQNNKDNDRYKAVGNPILQRIRDELRKLAIINDNDKQHKKRQISNSYNYGTFHSGSTHVVSGIYI